MLFDVLIFFLHKVFMFISEKYQLFEVILFLVQALDSIKKSLPKKDKGKDKEKGKAKPVAGFSADDAKRLEKEVILDKIMHLY